MMSEHPPPPLDTPFIHHFRHVGLCRARIKHFDQFLPSYYRFESNGLSRAQNPKKCKFAVCQIAVTWWIAGCRCNMPSSMAAVHAEAKRDATRISKKFSRRVATFGSWQES